MRESLFETLVGVLVVAVAGVFLFFSLQQRSDASPRDSYTLTAKFNRVDGISAGSDVRMAGVKVGAVSGITGGSTSLSEMKLTSVTARAIGSGTSARVRCRASVPSRLVTHGFPASRGWSCPWPTSTA